MDTYGYEGHPVAIPCITEGGGTVHDSSASLCGPCLWVMAACSWNPPCQWSSLVMLAAGASRQGVRGPTTVKMGSQWSMLSLGGSRLVKWYEPLVQVHMRLKLSIGNQSEPLSPRTTSCQVLWPTVCLALLFNTQAASALTTSLDAIHSCDHSETCTP